MLYKNTLTFFQKNKCDCPHCYLSPCTTLIVPLFVEASDVQISILNNCVRIEHSSHFNLLLITSYYTVQLGRQFCRSKALHWLLLPPKIRKFQLISWSPKISVPWNSIKFQYFMHCVVAHRRNYIRHICFLVNFLKFLRTPFFMWHPWWLLLRFDLKYCNINISIT